jgi:hypothetical protein
MEIRPNSGPERTITSTFEDIPPDADALHLERPEYLAINNATEISRGPKYTAYSSVAARLRSFTNWPKETNPSPASLSRAGFYFCGKILLSYLYSTFKLKKTLTLHSFSTGQSDITQCFHCGLTLHDWKIKDCPVIQHAIHSPLCVFIRFAQGDAFVHCVTHKQCTHVIGIYVHVFF